MHILNSMPPRNLFGLESQDYKSAAIAVLPIPYDSTVSYGAGAREGPKAIIDASRHIELFNEELGFDPSKSGIFTLEELEPNVDSPAAMVNAIAKEVAILLEDGKTPLLLGGEHTIALGAIKALADAGRKFSVLHFDAHSDSRDEFMGSRYSHACVASRAKELAGNCYSIGVRSIDEASFNKGGSILYMKDIHSIGPGKAEDWISRNVKGDIYITIDLDVLDPSEMPSVGTPEPDGMRYKELTSLLKYVLSEHKLLGADISELAPIPYLKAPDYLAAKLAYMLIGYSLRKSSMQ